MTSRRGSKGKVATLPNGQGWVRPQMSPSVTPRSILPIQSSTHKSQIRWIESTHPCLTWLSLLCCDEDIEGRWCTKWQPFRLRPPSPAMCVCVCVWGGVLPPRLPFGIRRRPLGFLSPLGVHPLGFTRPLGALILQRFPLGIHPAEVCYPFVPQLFTLYGYTWGCFTPKVTLWNRM
jgi:hypothetical protein